MFLKICISFINADRDWIQNIALVRFENIKILPSHKQ
jgi:hypothetical protein